VATKLRFASAVPLRTLTKSNLGSIALVRPSGFNRTGGCDLRTRKQLHSSAIVGAPQLPPDAARAPQSSSQSWLPTRPSDAGKEKDEKSHDSNNQGSSYYRRFFSSFSALRETLLFRVASGALTIVTAGAISYHLCSEVAQLGLMEQWFGAEFADSHLASKFAAYLSEKTPGLLASRNEYYSWHSGAIAVILGINLLVFAGFKFGNPEFMFKHFTCSYRHLREGLYHTLITSVFAHENAWHLALNCFALASFGPQVLAAIGTQNFVSFYLVAGAASSLLGVFSGFLMPRAGRYFALMRPQLGASGSIFGILGIFAVLYPNARLALVLFPFFSFTAGSALPFLALFDVAGLAYNAFYRPSPLGHGAHLTGLLLGWLYGIWFLDQVRKRREAIAARGVTTVTIVKHG
jgi:membrane associated rhomboid family serine protease